MKGFEIGDGFEAAKALGSTNNDEYTYSPDNEVIKLTNHSGGILGGISDGSAIILRAAIKPTPSIASMQSTITKDLHDVQVSIKGRHDPIIVPRAVVVVESMVALTLLDMIFASATSTMDKLVEFYR